MTWSLVGLIASLTIAAISWQRSRSPGGFYDREVYAMGAPAHRRYAAVSLIFACFFVVTCALRAGAAGIDGLALYALVAVLYGTSFLRGASDD